MDIADALARAIEDAKTADPIDYDYIHALKAAAVRCDQGVTDVLAGALEELLEAEGAALRFVDPEYITVVEDALRLYRGHSPTEGRTPE